MAALDCSKCLMILAAVLVSTLSARAQVVEPCRGHQLLDAPRADDSCQTVKPVVHQSPDLALRAVIYPVGMELHASPDIESRVVIRGLDAKLLTSKDHSSPRGANGFYVVHGRWSPDSQFFVYSMSSSGGHSPWSFPTWVFSRSKGVIFSLNDAIGGRATVADDFSFSGLHSVTAVTQERPDSDKQVQIVVDLEKAAAKLPPDQN